MPNGLFQRTSVPKMVISCQQGRCEIYRKSLVVTKWSKLSQKCRKSWLKGASTYSQSCPKVVPKLSWIVPKLSNLDDLNDWKIVNNPFTWYQNLLQILQLKRLEAPVESKDLHVPIASINLLEFVEIWIFGHIFFNFLTWISPQSRIPSHLPLIIRTKSFWKSKTWHHYFIMYTLWTANILVFKWDTRPILALELVHLRIK